MAEQLPHLYQKIREMMQKDIEEHNRRKKEIDATIMRGFRITNEDMKRVNEELSNMGVVKRESQRKFKIF